MAATAQLKRSASVAAILALAALSAAARAATEADQAEALIREGVQLRAHDKAAAALPVFEKAYQISRTPRTAAQLGLCELELGAFVAAERHLNEALAGPEHPWVKKNKATLKKSVETARASIGELALIVSPPGAEVLVNHKPVEGAQPGAPLRLDKGLVDLEVRAPGYEPAHDTITVVGGKTEQRTITLVPEAKPALALTAPPPATDAAALGTVPPPAREHRTQWIAAWITGGAAAGALVFGTVEALAANSKSNAFNGHTGVMNGVVYQDCGTAQLTPACKSLKDDYGQALTLSIVGFAAAGALAATSSVLFVRSWPGHGAERDGTARALACVPDPVARGLGCSVRF